MNIKKVTELLTNWAKWEQDIVISEECSFIDTIPLELMDELQSLQRERRELLQELAEAANANDLRF